LAGFSLNGPFEKTALFFQKSPAIPLILLGLAFIDRPNKLHLFTVAISGQQANASTINPTPSKNN
jgi:hypothetical protein